MKSYNPRVFVVALLLIFTLLEVIFGGTDVTRAQSTVGQWSQPINLSISGSSTRPSLFIDAAGIYHAIWMDSTTGYYYRSSTDGVRWSAAQLVDFPFKRVDNVPKFLLDLSGNVHAFWTDRENVLSYARVRAAEIRLPGSWRTTKLAESAASFDVTVDGEGSVHLVYVRTLSTSIFGSGIYYRRTKDGGQTWTDGVPIYLSNYYHAITSKEANVRMASAIQDNKTSIFITWDNRTLKRIFLAKSNNAGISWSEPVEVDGPNSDFPMETPYNIQVMSQGQQVLLIWNSGLPENPNSRCVQYSRYSSDQGQNWGGRQVMFNDRWACPSENKFLTQVDSRLIIQSTLQGELNLIAWNGSNWSSPQIQSELAIFNNPETFHKVSLGCFQSSLRGNKLFVVGCDIAGVGDIWFTFRTIENVGAWFSQTSWSPPTNIKSGNDPISAPILLADTNGVFHAFWTQVEAGNDFPVSRLFYKKWTNERWSQDFLAVSSPTGSVTKPKIIYLVKDNSFIAFWQDSLDELIYFSKVTANSASSSVSWTKPAAIPTKEKGVSSYDVKGTTNSGVVSLVYAIPINEQRGIYLIQSPDLGINWNSTLRLFSATAADDARIENPQIVIDTRGTLHVIWSTYSVLSSEAKGIYYSNSKTVGATWSSPVQVVNSKIATTGIAITGDTGLLISWQSANENQNFLWYQYSRDGGENWEAPKEITNATIPIGSFVLTNDPSYGMHLFRVVQDKNKIYKTLELWTWISDKWVNQGNNVLSTDPRLSIQGLAAEVSSTGLTGILYSSFEKITTFHTTYFLNYSIRKITLTSLSRTPGATTTAPSLAATNAPTPKPAFTTTPAATRAPDATVRPVAPVEVEDSSQSWMTPVLMIGSISIALGLMLGVYVLRKRRTL